MATRVLTAFAISPCAGIGGAVATEVYFAHERAQRVGWWTLTTSIGPPCAPLIFGWVVDYLGTNWVFWILAMINFCQFLAYVAVNLESRYVGRHQQPETGTEETTYGSLRHQSRVSYRRIDNTPWSSRQIYSCIFVLRHADVALVIFAVTMMTAFLNISMIVEIPAVLGQKFNLSGGQIGLQCLGPIIGSLVGEQIGGRTSDYIIRRHYRRSGKHNYALRLHLTHIAWAAAVAGTITFYVQTERAHVDEWNVTPLIGAGVAWFGAQILITTLITFAVDCHRDDAMDITMLSNLTRHVWGFVSIPFACYEVIALIWHFFINRLLLFSFPRCSPTWDSLGQVAYLGYYWLL